jgi:hypothetical protein
VRGDGYGIALTELAETSAGYLKSLCQTVNRFLPHEVIEFAASMPVSA